MSGDIVIRVQMQPKVLEKERAVELRKRGKSLREIARELSVAKSSVSVWCRDICLTKMQFDKLRGRESAPKLGALANKIKRQKEIVAIRKEAKKEIKLLDPRDDDRLRDIGTILYWAEGAKTGKQVDLTNSDPNIIKLGMHWLRRIYNVPEEKFRAAIYYHSNQNEYEIMEYWSSITGIPLSQFHKSILKKEGTGQRKNVLYNGTCKVRVCDANLLQKILALIENFYI